MLGTFRDILIFEVFGFVAKDEPVANVILVAMVGPAGKASETHLLEALGGYTKCPSP